MELKDVILSTLAEMEDAPPKETQTFEIKEIQKIVSENIETPAVKIEEESEIVSINSHDSEMMYLNSIRERLLVLFEGFQAPNNTNIEAKMDLTLNFLEYVLATIDARVEKLEKGNS